MWLCARGSLQLVMPYDLCGVHMCFFLRLKKTAGKTSDLKKRNNPMESHMESQCFFSFHCDMVTGLASTDL